MPLKVKKVTGPTIAASVQFNGSTQYLSLPNTSTMQMGTSDYTVEAWIYPTANGQANTSQIFAQSAAGVSSQFIVGLTSANKIVNYIEYAAGGGSAGPIITSATSITLNTWTHIATARVSGVTRIFINGVLDASASDAGGYRVVSHNFSIGSQNGAGSTFFTGYISNLRVIKGTGLYTTNFTPPNATLSAVTNTALLTCHDTSIYDASTNNFTITNNNTATVSTVSPFPVLRSVLFNGTSQYLTVANSSALQLNTGNFTIEGWIYATAFQASSAGNDLATVCDKDGIQGSTYSSYSIRCTNSSGVIKLKVDCNTSSGGGTTGAVTSTTTINTGTWYHFAYVRNGATAYLYINGTQEASAGIVDFYTTTNPVYIGYGNNSVSRFYWPGYISNFRIVKGTAVYTSSFTPAGPLTAITSCSLLTCNDQTIRDASVNNFTVTNNNTATVSTVVPFTVSLASSMKFKKTTNAGAAGRSVSFNGSSQYLTLSGNAVFAFGTGDFTVEGWVYLSAAQGNQYIVDARSPAYTNNWCFGWGLGSVGLFQWYYNGVIATNSSTTDFNTNTWYHVAYVRSGSTGTLYKNGVSVGTGADTNNYNVTSETVTIARRFSTVSSADYFGGNISNFRIVKGTAVYTASFTPPTTPLTAIANTSLLTCNAATIVDASSNNFTITNNGTATVSSAVTPFLSTPGTFKVKKSAGVYMVATGGDLITTSGSYKIHTFTTVGTSSFTINSIGSTPSIEYLIVGGGGAGGSNNNCGGGGAGGLIYNTASLSVGTYTITVGQSGSVASGVSNGNNGGNSTFNGLIALGGGGGGGSTAGSNGGSGGGNGGGGFGGTDSGGGAGLQPTSSYGGFGNKGGFSAGASSYPGGGGGGAGAAGGNGSGANGGNGGIGKAYAFAGALTYYAGGGGGSLNPGTAGTGGLGGGGNGRSTIGVGIAATGYGSGGGGGLSAGSGGEGGAGSPGIILIKYRYTD